MNALIPVAMITAVPSTLAAIGSYMNARRMSIANHKVDAVIDKVEAVHAEVRTGNALTVGEKSYADETRRIEAIPAEARTEAEQEHLKAMEEGK